MTSPSRSRRSTAAQVVRAASAGRLRARGEDAGVHLHARRDPEHRARGCRPRRRCRASCRRRRRRGAGRRRAAPSRAAAARVSSAVVVAAASSTTLRARSRARAPRRRPSRRAPATIVIPSRCRSRRASARSARAGATGCAPSSSARRDDLAAVGALQPDAAAEPGDRVDDQPEPATSFDGSSVSRELDATSSTAAARSRRSRRARPP